MCGRFTLKSPAAVLGGLFGVPTPPTLPPRFNVAPTQDVFAVRAGSEGEDRKAVLLRWGLIPSWAKDPAIGNKMINARAETAAEKPSFRAAMKKRRCLIAADGFFEWAKAVDGPKIPHLITLESGAPFAFAGLWESWSPGDTPPVESCTILTTSASPALENIHHRMPVILEPGDWPRWLDCGDGRSPAPVELLAPRDDLAGDPLVFHPVSRRVNNPSNDDAACLEPTP